MSLSKEIFGEDNHCEIKVIAVDKVKEFIKELKEINPEHLTREDFDFKIDKLAGEKLVVKTGKGVQE